MAVSHSRGVPPIRTFIFAVVLAASSAGAGAQPLALRAKNRSEPPKTLRYRYGPGTERLLIVDEEASLQYGTKVLTKENPRTLIRTSSSLL